MKLRSIAVLAAVLAAAACSSTTAGSGRVGARSAGSASPDFPSGSAPASGAASAAASSGASTGAPGSGGSTNGVPTAPIRTVAVQAPDGTAYTVKIWADVTDDTCFDHAHGNAIVTFLTEHPCTGLRRYLGTTTVQGRPVGFALSSTGFHGPAGDPYKWAGQFVKLENADGTGSIDDLLSDGYRLPAGPGKIPAGEAFDVVGQDEGVTVWDAWYLDGPTPDNDPPLMKMTRDLFLQF